MERSDPPYTGWHVLFLKLLETTVDPAKLEVRPFDRLGALPLEADGIVLRRTAEDEGLFRFPDLEFLRPYLGRYTVLEYKSPKDRLQIEDFDTCRAYGYLCKRKYGLKEDREVHVMFLYSHVAMGYFEACERFGFGFRELEPGVRHCAGPGMSYYALDLLVLGERYPESLVNLTTARWPRFGPEPGARPNLHVEMLCAILSQELRKMLQSQIDIEDLGEIAGNVERLQQVVGEMLAKEEWARRIALDHSTPEERLRGLGAEERLRGLGPEDRERLLALLLANHPAR